MLTFASYKLPRVPICSSHGCKSTILTGPSHSAALFSPAFTFKSIVPSRRKQCSQLHSIILPPPAADGDRQTLSSLGETAALDQLIDSLITVRDANELAKRVAENITSYDQKFWLRLATRADTASSQEEKDQLSTLARVVMQLVDAMLKKTNEQLNESASFLQTILKAAADKNTGEWELPLSKESLTAMSAVMDDNADKLDEALLSNCFAWMKKASEDNLDGMVALLQIVLQLYAAKQLGQQQQGEGETSSSSSVDQFVTQLLKENEQQWDILLKQGVEKYSESSFMEALQKRMEAVVLGLPSGSYAQRVQAEYLKEVEARAKAAFSDDAIATNNK